MSTAIENNNNFKKVTKKKVNQWIQPYQQIKEKKNP